MLVLANLSTNPVLYAFGQSDGFARFIVGLLFLLSIYAWSIMVEKWLTLRRVRKNNQKFLASFEREDAALGVALLIDDYRGPVVDVYKRGVEEVLDILDVAPHQEESVCRTRRLPRPLTTAEADKIRSALDRAVDAQAMALEERLGLLGTIVSISPFLGLLGTVWGVMLAFIGMAQKGRPDIGAIAPGVSGALLTTVVGLVVAIPSVVGNNLILSVVEKTTVEMENFVENFIALIRLEDKE
ncbi:MAG: MotA/TolQ/ExbB proton channel family protein [Lentisphaeria bacterium]|nr:MotA/TolQ/ExbB proton channel family protein [Lentisphaeria bacterium]